VQLVPNQGWDARVHICRCGPIVDSFVVVCARFVVLIDTLISPQTARALLAIVQPHLVDGRQLLVVNTHVDWDHFWGNQLFAGPQASHPTPIFASRRSVARFNESEATQRFLAEMRAERPGRYDDVQITQPTIFFDDRLRIDGGDLTLELFPTPGHQPDHVSIFIPEIRTLLAGDAAEFPFPFPESAATLPLLRDSIARMAALDATTVLYCHAPVTSGPTLLRDNIAYFDMLEQRCRAALSRGVPALPAADVDIEQLIGYPFAAVVADRSSDQPLPDMYRTGHQAAIRMMLEYVSGDRRG
jgi:glyoxylase-like metal-dependent hydrolase (beta-lactamase superfamily II)